MQHHMQVWCNTLLPSWPHLVRHGIAFAGVSGIRAVKGHVGHVAGVQAGKAVDLVPVAAVLITCLQKLTPDGMKRLMMGSAFQAVNNKSWVPEDLRQQPRPGVIKGQRVRMGNVLLAQKLRCAACATSCVELRSCSESLLRCRSSRAYRSSRE